MLSERFSDDNQTTRFVSKNIINYFLNINNVFNHRYAYQAYIQNTFYANKQYKDTALTSVAYFGDEGGSFQSCFTSIDDIKKVQNVLSRWKLTSTSDWADLTGPILIPFFDSENFLLNNMNLDIEFVRNTPEFILYDETTGVNYKIEIRNPNLTVRRYKPSAPFLKSIVRNLEGTKSKYSYRNIDMKATNFPKALSRISIPNITTGQIPSRIIFAFVDSKAFKGDLKKNPFYFQHFNLTEVNLFVNSEKYPGIPMSYDFVNRLTSQGYDFYLEQLGMHQSKTNGISKYDYEKGYTIFVFDLTTDMSASEDHFSMIQTGDINAEFTFSAPLADELTCIIYTEFEKLIEIDHFRNVSTSEQIF